MGMIDFKIDGIFSNIDFFNSYGNFVYWFEGCFVQVFGVDVVILEEYIFLFLIGDKDKVIVKVVENDVGIVFGIYLKDVLSFVDEYFNEKLEKDILIISDDDFWDFVEMFMEVIICIKIDNEMGIVQKGGFFIEEYLLLDSLMYSLVMSVLVF